MCLQCSLQHMRHFDVVSPSKFHPWTTIFKSKREFFLCMLRDSRMQCWVNVYFLPRALLSDPVGLLLRILLHTCEATKGNWDFWATVTLASPYVQFIFLFTLLNLISTLLLFSRALAEKDVDEREQAEALLWNFKAMLIDRESLK